MYVNYLKRKISKAERYFNKNILKFHFLGLLLKKVEGSVCNVKTIMRLIKNN